MKNIKALFLLSVLFLAAACSEDTEMNTYPARNDEAFFAKSAYSYAVSADLEDAYTIPVQRANAKGDVSVPLILTAANPDQEFAFSAPATVDFVDGSLTSTVKVSFDRSQFTVGEENVVTVSFPEPTKLPYATECKLTVVRDYTWTKWGQGTYFSYLLSDLFGAAISWTQVIERAEEDQTRYRLPDFYHNAGTRYSEAGYAMTFTWDGGDTATILAPIDPFAGAYPCVETGWFHPSYGMMYLVVKNVGYADNKFTFSYYPFVSLGQWDGLVPDTFTLE